VAEHKPVAPGALSPEWALPARPIERDAEFPRLAFVHVESVVESCLVTLFGVDIATTRNAIHLGWDMIISAQRGSGQGNVRRWDEFREAVVDHGPGAVTGFLGRLEQHDHGAVPAVCRSREEVCGAGQRGDNACRGRMRASPAPLGRPDTSAITVLA